MSDTTIERPSDADFAAVRRWLNEHDFLPEAARVLRWFLSRPPVVLPEPDENGDFTWPDGSTVRPVWYAHDPTDRLIATTRATAMEAAEALRDAGFGRGATQTGGAP